MSPAYKALTLNSSTYQIRGAGVADPSRILSKGKQAALLIVASLFAAAAAVLLIIAINPGEIVSRITVTPEQTRSALDSKMLKLPSNLINSGDDIKSELELTGASLIDIPSSAKIFVDLSATMTEILVLPGQADAISEDKQDSFFDTGFTGLSLSQLQTDFLGSYTLTAARGKFGGYNKVKYVNLAAQSLSSEIEYAINWQGLNASDSTEVYRGTDISGNSIVQGNILIDNRLIYWQVTACSLDSIGDESNLPNTVVLLSCQVADYNFYN